MHKQEMRCDSPDAKAKLDRIQIKWMRNQNKRWRPSQSKRCLVADDVIKLFHNCAKFYGIYTLNMVIVLERVSDILDHLECRAEGDTSSP
jgi:hypothetical protein